MLFVALTLHPVSLLTPATAVPAFESFAQLNTSHAMPKRAKLIPVMAVLLLLGGLIAVVLLDHTTPVTPVFSGNDPLTGLYWMTALKPDQQAPPHASFGQPPESMALCQISTLPEQKGMFFIIPIHPCYSLIRSIQIDEDGFHSIAATPQDNCTATITGRKRDDGVYTVKIVQEKDTLRFAIRLATTADQGRLRQPETYE
jgi:hypothetical protein